MRNWDLIRAYSDNQGATPNTVIVNAPVAIDRFTNNQSGMEQPERDGSEYCM